MYLSDAKENILNTQIVRTTANNISGFTPESKSPAAVVLYHISFRENGDVPKQRKCG